MLLAQQKVTYYMPIVKHPLGLNLRIVMACEFMIKMESGVLEILRTKIKIYQLKI